MAAAATDDPATAVDILQRLTQAEAAGGLGELRAEDAPAAERLLPQVEIPEVSDVRRLLVSPEDRVGALTTTGCLRVLAPSTVGGRRATLLPSCQVRSATRGPGFSHPSRPCPGPHRSSESREPSGGRTR